MRRNSCNYRNDLPPQHLSPGKPEKDQLRSGLVFKSQIVGNSRTVYCISETKMQTSDTQM